MRMRTLHASVSIIRGTIRGSSFLGGLAIQRALVQIQTPTGYLSLPCGART